MKASIFSSTVSLVILGGSVLAASYDYVIIGGGTCGLVIANRLSELPNVTVAIIEAGASVYNNPQVTDPSLYSQAFGSSIDYAYPTTNQVYANGKPAVMRAGKALGGTSTINGMAYTRAPIEQINSWESALGNLGWNWANLFPYYLKHENFTLPTTSQLVDGASYLAADHGHTGPVHTGWTYNLVNSTIFNTFQASNNAVGIPYNQDPNGGHMRGFNLLPKLVDRNAGIRADAARAYYFPYADRNNLHLFLNTYANKIIWNSTNGIPVAGGVQVAAADGTVSTIYANKEVILSAGSLRSPVILEMSGIGNPTILNQYNIPVVVNLPTVGENLQDQPNNAFFWKGNATLTGSSTFVAYPNVADMFGSNITNVAKDIQSRLSSYATKVSNASGGVTKASDLLKFFQNQYNLLFQSLVPASEIIYSLYSSTFDVEIWGLLPFSRGSVHIGSAAYNGQAVINPNYFLTDWDVTAQIAGGKLLRKIMAAQPVSSFIVKATSPTTTTLPTTANDVTWSSYLKSNYRPNWHPLGTAAMLPQNVGGVVSDKLKVYGTSNLRVIDASVLPFQVCGHLTSTLYAVAERAADLIKADL